MAPRSCREVWKHMSEMTAQGSHRNYTALITMSDYVVETPLFPRDVLEAYSAWNLGLPVSDTQRGLFSSERGGGQGDYREGMREKIDNVVDCLTRFPASKRAVIVISNDVRASHTSDEEAKCMRELHLYVERGRLCGTVLFRAQAALIFPKNIHFIGALMAEVASRLPGNPQPGELFYLATILVSDRA